MAITLSSGMSLAVTTPIIAALNGGFMRIFSGTRPATSDLAETGTLLGIVYTSGVSGAGLHYSASGPTIFNKTGDRWVFTAVASGTATWFRLVTPSDTGATSTTQVRLDGSIGSSVAPADMVWVSPVVTSGAVYTIDSFIYLLQPVGA